MFESPAPSTNYLVFGLVSSVYGPSDIDGNLWLPQIWSTNLSAIDIANLYFNQTHGKPVAMRLFMLLSPFEIRMKRTMKSATRIARAILCMLPLAVPAMVSAQQEFYAAPYYYQTNADGSATLTRYTGPGGSVVIPASISNLPVTGLYNTFGAEPFRPNVTLTDVTIPSSVVSIGYCSFTDCTSLTNVAISASVTSIGEFAFNDTALATITIPTNVTSIGDDAFSECINLTSLTIPSNVVSIGVDAFASCSALTNAKLYGITTLPAQAFIYCTSLECVTLPASIIEIVGNPFEYCPSLTEVFFMGNGPFFLSWLPDSGEVFSDNPNVTVYCLPGTAYWGFFSSITGVSPVLWNPLIQTGDGNFGVQNNQFGFDIKGTAGIPIVVEASTNLASPVWTPLTTGKLTNGLFHFSEPLQAGSPSRYYRISSP